MHIPFLMTSSFAAGICAETRTKLIAEQVATVYRAAEPVIDHLAFVDLALLSDESSISHASVHGFDQFRRTANPAAR